MMRKILVLLTLLMCVQLSGNARQKRALVICVSEQEDKSWGAINAKNDLDYVEKILEGSGYAGDMSIVAGKNATKPGILAAFDSLTCRCRPGDLVYIHFSGHGQRMLDVDGDESRRNVKDKYDESWIPYDAYMECCENDKGEKHLSDDEIAILLAGIKKVVGVSGQILVVVDACHSGGATRSDGKDLLEGMCVRGIENIFQIPASVKKRRVEFSEDWLTLSACKDYQTNVECVNPKVGKLTYMLYLLRNNLGKMTNDELKSELKKMMNSPLYKSPILQEPDLTGCTDKCEINIFF